MQERFYHLRVKTSLSHTMPNGGATILVRRHETDPMAVELRIARCRSSDVFNKAIGREQARTAPHLISRINIRDLPRAFKQVQHQAYRAWRDVRGNPLFREEFPKDRSRFNNLVRDWLPTSAVIYTPQENPPSTVPLTNDERLDEQFHGYMTDPQPLLATAH